MARASANGIELEYETFGYPSDPLLLLVMGIGGQLVAWPDGFCAALSERGFRVVRYDNRDVGLSSWFPAPAGFDMAAAVTAALQGPEALAAAGFPPRYNLTDMADDGIELVRALGAEAAHVVGMSMGGMIAQLMAIRHPERVFSLTSMMSTPDLRQAGMPTDTALGVLMQPAAATREGAIAQGVEAARVTGSTGFPFDEEAVRARTALSYDRAQHPDGFTNHLLALLTAEDRTPALAGIRMPTLVVHGDADPLIQPDGGRATAAAVPGAELLIVPGMGHDLPEEAWPLLAGAIAANAARAVAA